MLKRADHCFQAIYVGADEQLGYELNSSLSSKKGWLLRHVVDVETASTVQAEQPTAAVILYVDDACRYAQSLKYMHSATSQNIPVIVIYDCLEPEQLLELFRSGAVECLGRPVNLTRLSLVLDMSTVSANAKVGSNAVRATTSGDTDGLQDQLLEQVRAVASLTTTVLVTGETGTGKTRLSRLIHGLSDRRNKPFLALNCGALSESLIDTELFGHVKGAFTGADHDYLGKLAQCRDGTLLLDEIDTLSPVAQVKLLQVVEERVFQPVGSTGFQPFQARLIVASNKPLQQEMNEGRFRSDLFYRLNVMSFQLLPLRERRDEIERLASTFRAEFAEQHGFHNAPFAPRTVAALESYRWPGNIRELRNVIERAVILSAGKLIQPAHLPPNLLAVNPDELSSGRVQETSSVGNKLADARIEAERKQVIDSLRRNDNNRSKTALELGISRAALYKRLHKLQLL